MTTEVPISSDLYYSIVPDTPFYQLASPNCCWYCSGVRLFISTLGSHMSRYTYHVYSFPLAFPVSGAHQSCFCAMYPTRVLSVGLRCAYSKTT